MPRPTTAANKYVNAADGPKPGMSLNRWKAASTAKFSAKMRNAAIRKIAFQAKLARERQERRAAPAPGRKGKELTAALGRSVKQTILMKSSGLVARPELVNQSPSWHKLTRSEKEAAESFDAVHRKRVEAAHKVLQRSKSAAASMLPTDPTSRAFNARLRDVRLNRFHVVQTLEKVVIETKVRQKSPEREAYVNDMEANYTIPKSIFAPRAYDGNRQSDHAYYDTDEKLRQCIDLDMILCLSTHRMDTFIEQQGGTDEADACRTVLGDYASTVYGVFDFYCTLSKCDDICHMYAPAFKRFIADTQFEDKSSETCSPNDVTKLWKMLNTDPTESANYINRYEWLQALIRLAIMKYCPGTSVSLALKKLLNLDIMKRVDRRALHDLNEFRKTFCYVQDVDEVFLAWEPSLRNLFKVYALGDNVIDEIKSTELLGYDEWMNFVLDMDLYDAIDFSAREASCAWSWSRLREIDERPVKAKIRYTQLCFEEFLEALVRLATFKVIPLDDEVDVAGCADAGELMLQWRDMPKTERDETLMQSVVDWDDHLNQPLFHLLEGLILYLVYIVAGKGATKITGKDAARYKQGMDANSGAEREKLRAKARACFVAKPVEPVDDTKTITEDQKIMASLFGCVSGKMPEFDD